VNLACVFLTTTKKHEAHFYLPLLLASETVTVLFIPKLVLVHLFNRLFSLLLLLENLCVPEIKESGGANLSNKRPGPAFIAWSGKGTEITQSPY
jgi:hypothetical protein